MVDVDKNGGRQPRQGLIAMKGIRVATVIAALTAWSPVTAHAQTCGGSTFMTCASVSITKTDKGGGVTEIAMTIMNLSGMNGSYAGTIFTTIGLYALGNFSYVVGSLSTVGSGSWTLGTNGLSGSGITGNVAGVQAVPPPVQNGLAQNQSATFTFRITGVTFASINTDDWAIHGQNGPLDLGAADGSRCSTKLVNPVNTSSAGPFDPNCASPTVTPEPASIALLGTGLAGLVLGGGMRRRRRG